MADAPCAGLAAAAAAGAAHLFDCLFAAKSGDQRVGGGDLAVTAAA